MARRRTPTRSRALSGLAALALVPLTLTACSAGSLGSSSASGGGGTTITWLTGSDATAQATATSIVEAFEEANPDIDVELDGRPAGGEGDNLVKTRLQTGSMADVFDYNSGSLFQQIAPEKNLTPLGEDVVGAVEDSYLPQVSAGGDAYGVPYGTAFGGGVMYNMDVYSQLGLEVPKTWAEFVANSEAIKAAGIAPVVQTFGDTWTSQLFVLGDFHNVLAADPDWAEEYTAGNAKYATDPVAIKGFEHTQEVHDKGFQNADFASAKLEDGMRQLASGQAAMYPILSGNITTLLSVDPEAGDRIGFFALPGDDAATNGLTAWYPNAVYIPNSTTGEELEAAKKLAAFIASPEGCEAQSQAAPPTGPYLVEGCELPDDVPQVTKDVQAYFDADAQSPALEFLSPVKGPALEQITVEVGSGIRSAQDGAALYDQDVEKQAQQLGLEGW
ncbi:extracellular solute-binding protein [Paenibacillus sp. TRM 82003]|uniref:ABC transporter substrate-binding protein n=1 Tax=Kineococcus sp. TRM81007 TaxID=2925831 RepID=UPI001F578A65|nr:extracellular solute-binding protein [Kineococcus sp. TRM81007]MCI2237544.1 extracellular solute-binding protein [Kineococcus sp. TRM81007]MCI3919898.1 extracellular solute-binding protein [Paenibacillus sp. TRM 82003]